MALTYSYAHTCMHKSIVIVKLYIHFCKNICDKMDRQSLQGTKRVGEVIHTYFEQKKMHFINILLIETQLLHIFIKC